MKQWLVAGLLLVTLMGTGKVQAQSPFNAQWIWFDEGNPARKAPEGKVWFRREIRSAQPSTGSARILCDDSFVLWVNGRRIGAGSGEKIHRFNLNGIVDRGMNVIAIEATNKSGKAGLYVDGDVRGQSGTSYPFDSGAEWFASRVAPEGNDWLKPNFNNTAWRPVKVIGPHEKSPWNSIVLKETYLDRYDLAQGFELKRIAEPDLVGSLICITWGNNGRLIASRERGPVLSLIDTDGDGTYDKVVEYSTDVKNCQGLCTIFDDVYAVGEGPSGVGIYRLPDKNHDDKADTVEHVYTYKGRIGDHGPHDIIYGPDGWLYGNMGNHAWVTNDAEPTTAVRNSYEGDLLRPKFEDARGHASGIKVPGGTIWRFTPDGKKWWNETAGFRNEYDFAFNSQGDMFSFDSDMEWDVGMPWYRPVRVTHCIPGAEFGWRSGAAKWPSYYFDSLPGTVDIGRGSPTGVVFYEHRQFPKKYHGAFIVCDWSLGRIISVSLKQQGATYTGTFENLVTGNPLNVSDIEVDRDGSLVFSTGGRGSEGGVYRVTYTAGNQKPVRGTTIDFALKVPQLHSAWAREMISSVKKNNEAQWEPTLLHAAKTGKPSQKIRALTLLSQFGPKPSTETLLKATGDKSPGVRAFATYLLGNHAGEKVKEKLTQLLSDKSPVVQRRACEAFVRSGIEPPFDAVTSLLGHKDRWVRYAARLAAERISLEIWKKSRLASEDPHSVTHGLLVLHRVTKLPPEMFFQIEKKLLDGKYGKLDDEQKLNTLRMIQLTMLSVEGEQPAEAAQIGEMLLGAFPTGNEAIDAEVARILAMLDVEGATEKIVKAMESTESPQRQMHYALTLRYLKTGWNLDLKRRLLDWFETTQDWEGGNSMQPYLANIVGASLERYNPEERKQLLLTWAERPYAAGLIIRNSRPEQIADFDRVVGSILSDSGKDAGRRGREQLITQSIQAIGRSKSPAAKQSLRNLYEANPDRREQLARAMASRPTAKDWPYLVRTLQFADPDTTQLSIAALGKLNRKPEKPDEYRSAILAGMKLDKQGGLNAAGLLQKWTGSKHGAGKNIEKAMAHYSKWYSQKFPDAPPAELPKQDLQKTKYSFDQLFAFLENNPKGRSGDPKRGKLMFTKANCIKCHRFLNEGETIGPDLTSVRRRFQRKEIIESMVYPSQVISDQYRMVTVVTVDGLVHNGMPIPSVSNRAKLVLLLPDATRLEIPKRKIDEQVRSKISVMPVGILKDLTLEEIADLFAFLETSRFNEVTSRDATTKAGKEKKAKSSGGG